MRESLSEMLQSTHARGEIHFQSTMDPFWAIFDPCSRKFRRYGGRGSSAEWVEKWEPPRTIFWWVGVGQAPKGCYPLRSGQHGGAVHIFPLRSKHVVRDLPLVVHTQVLHICSRIQPQFFIVAKNKHATKSAKTPACKRGGMKKTSVDSRHQKTYPKKSILMP